MTPYHLYVFHTYINLGLQYNIDGSKSSRAVEGYGSKLCATTQKSENCHSSMALHKSQTNCTPCGSHNHCRVPRGETRSPSMSIQSNELRLCEIIVLAGSCGVPSD